MGHFKEELQYPNPSRTRNCDDLRKIAVQIMFLYVAACVDQHKIMKTKFKYSNISYKVSLIAVESCGPYDKIKKTPLHLSSADRPEDGMVAVIPAVYLVLKLVISLPWR